MQLQINVIQARQAHRLHRVNMIEPGLCRVSHGIKRVFLGDESVSVYAGQWLLLPAHINLGIENEPGPQGYLAQVLSFPQQLVSEFHQFHAHHLPQANHFIGLRHWRIEQHARLDVAWLRLQQSLTDQEPFVLQKHLLHEMLLILGLSDHLSPLLNLTDGALPMRLQLLLMSDPSADWSQEVVAMQFCMSAPTLRRHLAAHGQTFRGILDDVRMAHALNHLQTTRSSIEDIAHACGYSSASRFATRFRQRFGLSPKALRKVS